MIFRDYFPDRLKFSVKMLVLLIYLFILLILSILTYKDMFRSALGRRCLLPLHIRRHMTCCLDIGPPHGLLPFRIDNECG